MSVGRSGPSSGALLALVVGLAATGATLPEPAAASVKAAGPTGVGPAAMASANAAAATPAPAAADPEGLLVTTRDDAARAAARPRVAVALARLARLEQAGDTAGIVAYRLGDADAVTAEGFPEPAVLVNGGIHAREWQSPETLSAILEWLAEEAGDDGIGSYLAGNLHTVLIPVLNVDGFLQTQRFPATVTATPAQPRDGRMRRKNLREADTGGVIDADLGTRGDNFWGVDLNRNSPEGHGLNQGSSPNPVSLVYRAAVPSSEPEIVALQQGASLAPPERLRLYIDVHSFTQIYLAPQTGNPRRDAITAALAERMRAVGDGGAWLGQPGGAPDGYLRYRDDALAVEFTLPADLVQGGTSGALSAQLRLENRDLSGLALDADPATAADWAQGHWTGYESAVGNEGDPGGADCSFKPWVAADDSGSAPATSPGCFSATTGGGGSGGGTSSGGGGGGGGAPHPVLLATFACALFARRLPQRVLPASRRAPASSRES